jgi:hypothetical protein
MRVIFRGRNTFRHVGCTSTNNWFTERCSEVDNAPASYLKSSGF